MKLVGNEQIGKKTVRRYDEADTSYQRVLRMQVAELRNKAYLCYQYLQRNPVVLRNHIEDNVAKLWKLVR